MFFIKHIKCSTIMKKKTIQSKNKLSELIRLDLVCLLTSSCDEVLWVEIVWTVGAPPKVNGHGDGSDLMTTEDAAVVGVKVVEVNWLVVAEVNLKTPFWASWANWSEVKTRGAAAFGGGGGSEEKKTNYSIYCLTTFKTFK